MCTDSHVRAGSPVVKLGRYYRYRPDVIDHFELRGLDEPLERHSPARLEAI